MENQEKKTNTQNESISSEEFINAFFGPLLDSYKEKKKVNTCIICDERFETSALDNHIVCPNCKHVIKVLRGIDGDNNEKI